MSKGPSIRSGGQGKRVLKLLAASRLGEEAGEGRQRWRAELGGLVLEVLVRTKSHSPEQEGGGGRGLLGGDMMVKKEGTVTCFKKSA